MRFPLAPIEKGFAEGGKGPAKADCPWAGLAKATDEPACCEKRDGPGNRCPLGGKAAAAAGLGEGKGRA